MANDYNNNNNNHHTQWRSNYPTPSPITTYPLNAPVSDGGGGGFDAFEELDDLKFFYNQGTHLPTPIIIPSPEPDNNCISPLQLPSPQNGAANFAPASVPGTLPSRKRRGLRPHQHQRQQQQQQRSLQVIPSNPSLCQTTIVNNNSVVNSNSQQQHARFDFAFAASKSKQAVDSSKLLAILQQCAEQSPKAVAGKNQKSLDAVGPLVFLLFVDRSDYTKMIVISSELQWQ